MGNTATVRYVGPHTDGVTLERDGIEFPVEFGEWTALPVDIVHGTPHVFERGYVPKDGEEIDGDQLVKSGRASLLDLSEVATETWPPADARASIVDGRAPVWELQSSNPPANQSAAKASGRKPGAAK